ncbi:hypothetical protein KC678_05565 [Candidatus Dojkabacteria bacterium]|uniref:Uncharacterized protein n=1 Tax=Candidatus Dojkabacteria bacterium TaxID=2099670 RepID=A0A955L2J2_9BACT|nr:hypothetical protein [Candidatus Dojkabacteria bacterium]
MKETKRFICETYNLPEDIVLIKHAVDTYTFDYKQSQYFLICAPSNQELAAMQAFITYLNNKGTISQKVVTSIGGSDFVVHESKFCTLYKTPPLQSVYTTSLTKTKLSGLLGLIKAVLNEGEYLADMFLSKETYIVPQIAEKIVRQLSKAKNFFEDNNEIKVTAYDSIVVHLDMISLLENQLRQLIEKLNTDITRTSINMNIENSFFNNESGIKMFITDKLFLGHPFFIFSKVASEMFIFESAIEEEDLINQVMESYDEMIPNHFTQDFFESMIDIYLLIRLYKIAKLQIDTGDQKEFYNIAKGLYRSKVVEWI